MHYDKPENEEGLQRHNVKIGRDGTDRINPGDEFWRVDEW